MQAEETQGMVLFSFLLSPGPSATAYSDGVKCRGGPPCDYCVLNGVDCQTDELSDMRRKGAMERKIEQLEDAERLLLDLVETLKKDEQNVRTCQLINLIRSNASLGEIRLFLERQFSPEELERMPEVVETQNHLARIPKEESYARPRRCVMAIQRLADIPIYRVPAKPWTTVTDDDNLVSHLISIWLTWSHPWFRWVNRDLFIRDMQAGNLDCEFCSPFLVNAILAETSVCINMTASRTDMMVTDGCISFCYFPFGIAALFRLLRSIYSSGRDDIQRRTFPRGDATLA